MDDSVSLLDSERRPSIAGDEHGAVVVRGAVSGERAVLLRRAAIDAVEAIARSPLDRPVVMDLAHCTALDDAAVVALVCAHHRAVRCGRRLVVRGPSRSVLRTIRDRSTLLLALVEGAAPVRSRKGSSLRFVIDATPPCPPSCERVPGGDTGCSACPAELAVAARGVRTAAVRGELRCPSSGDGVPSPLTPIA